MKLKVSLKGVLGPCCTLGSIPLSVILLLVKRFVLVWFLFLFFFILHFQP